MLATTNMSGTDILVTEEDEAYVSTIMTKTAPSIGTIGGEECQQINEQRTLSEEEALDNLSLRKKKHRRGKTKKRRWKPYYKMSWQEKRELEERETLRANRIRAEMLAHGQPLAPYNTTQFLMEDHNVQEPDYEHIPNCHRHNRENSVDSSDEYYSSPEDEEDFLQKQFTEAYDNIHAERLNAMSKTELVQEYILLEDKVEELENQLKKVSPSSMDRLTAECEVQTVLVHEDHIEKVRIFKEEIKKLTDENNRLVSENELLRSRVVENGS